VPRRLRLLEVDGLDLEQGEVALPFLRRTNLPGDGVARTQIEAANLGGGDVDVVGTGQVVLVRRPQEAEAIGQRLEHALGVDLALVLCGGLEHREDHVLLAHPRGVLDVEPLRQGRELRHVLGLELLHVHALTRARV
jgi:hypothetical protein